MSYNGLLKKTVCAALAGASILACGGMFAGCTTSHPEVEMKISFNNVTYTLEYKLYRKIAPATVTHFMELVDAGYYNGLCIHNYTSTRLYTGGYTYDENNKEDNGGLVDRDYFDFIEENNLKLTQTVWRDKEKTQPTNTLRGESSAFVSIGGTGAVKQSYGSLTMYYTSKANNASWVYVSREKDGGVAQAEYKNNSATSLFYISTSAGTSATPSGYCTFATLTGDGADTLKDLLDAINEYVEENIGEDGEFAPTVSVPVDRNDPFVGDSGASADYSVPEAPIIVTSVKVTKY